MSVSAINDQKIESEAWAMREWMTPFSVYGTSAQWWSERMSMPFSQTKVSAAMRIHDVPPRSASGSSRLERRRARSEPITQIHTSTWPRSIAFMIGRYGSGLEVPSCVALA
jgi:hypothetical protein